MWWEWPFRRQPMHTPGEDNPVVASQAVSTLTAQGIPQKVILSHRSKVVDLVWNFLQSQSGLTASFYNFKFQSLFQHLKIFVPLYFDFSFPPKICDNISVTV